ncbi:Choline-sulfatase [Pirellulimonas nuda]|uniref:Choline-sulfatase n=1 Tax=Pirellulimonas nuda TaxID=2528009 RepID=A0A518DDK8_9BACT|nr:sulfatase [Pirellulimonas nuda]QDU89574.1 Choline-sulfatase [Pirellulimonas nuda]
MIHRNLFSLTLLSAAGLFLSATGVAPAVDAADRRPNVLLICVDDLRPELGCYGVDYIHSPNIDRLAARGRVFHRHYVQAPTCGASRAALLTGRYGGRTNSALFERAARSAEEPGSVSPSMPAWFRKHGYTTVAVGKVSHHPGGKGGDRWNDPSKSEMPDAWDACVAPSGPWKDPRGWMHGLAHGEIRGEAKPGGGVEMDVMQSVEGPDSIYPDGIAIDEALARLERLATDEQPFFLAVGVLRPHLPFGAPAEYLARYADVELPATPHPSKPPGRTTWHRSGEFMQYDRDGRDPNTDAQFAVAVRKHYAACVSYADAQVGRLLDALERTGSADETLIVLWGDHGWHLGEHAIWGKHALFEESLRSPLIVAYPGLPRPGESTDAIVESIDLFPTLCELARLPMPGFVHGASLTPILEDPTSAGSPAVSYSPNAETIRTNRRRLVLHHDGYCELYDHTTPEGETKNVAEERAGVVRRLTRQLASRLLAE